MDFSDALIEMKKGIRMARKGWNGKGMWVKLFRTMHVPDKAQSEALGLSYAETPTMTDFLVIKSPTNQFTAWTISQSDALATDWEYAE